MSTPSIQTLITQAQQVLNLKSSNEIRATLAAVLANANVGTPLNPNLTTQQLWDEFYEIVRQPSDDIMSIITDQMMRMVFSPPAPGGAGADKQVIFNDGGVLAGDTKFLWDKTANRLDVDGPVVITGDLTARNWFLTGGSLPGVGNGNPFAYRIGGGGLGIGAATETGTTAPIVFYCGAGGVEQYRIAPLGVNTWSDGAGGTRMTLNSTGLGVGISPQTGYKITTNGNVAFWNASRAEFLNTDNTAAFAIQGSGSSSTATWNLVQLGVTNRMTFDWSGNMILNLSNTPPTLATNGQLTVNATSNTNLRFSYRGSDGTTRVANILLV
jgi:hypothetical protein